MANFSIETSRSYTDTYYKKTCKLDETKSNMLLVKPR